MYRGVKVVERNEKAADDLEPYRRLVELQKQVIALAAENEKARQECAVLRERMAAEVIDGRQMRRGLRHRLREQAAKMWRRLPRFVREESRRTRVNGDGMDDSMRKAAKVLDR